MYVHTGVNNSQYIIFFKTFQESISNPIKSLVIIMRMSIKYHVFTSLIQINLLPGAMDSSGNITLTSTSCVWVATIIPLLSTLHSLTGFRLETSMMFLFINYSGVQCNAIPETTTLFLVPASIKNFSNFL